MCNLPVCLSTRVTLAFTGVGLLVFLTCLVGLLPNGRWEWWASGSVFILQKYKLRSLGMICDPLTCVTLTLKVNHVVVCFFLQAEKLPEWKGPFDVLQNMCQSSDCHYNLPWQVKDLQSKCHCDWFFIHRTVNFSHSNRLPVYTSYQTRTGC